MTSKLRLREEFQQSALGNSVDNVRYQINNMLATLGKKNLGRKISLNG